MSALFVQGSSSRTTIVSYSMAIPADGLSEHPIPRLEDEQQTFADELGAGETSKPP
jgi:hypothetical protein